MAEIPVLKRLTASDLFLVQWNDSSWFSDIGGLAILDGTDLALVSATTDSDVEQIATAVPGRAAAVAGGR